MSTPQATHDDAAITVTGLSVRRGDRHVLRDVNLRVGRGVVTGLVGPSGAGKTTLLRAIVGVQKVESGTVSVLGLEAGDAPLRRRVGYVTQSPSVYTDLTVAENLRYFARIVGVEAARIADVLEDVGLEAKRDQVVRTLSGGERSRCSLAAALLGQPDVLILDEPTVGLDPVLRRDLWILFHRLSGRGATLLVSTHVMDEAAHCDQLILMRDTQILRSETAPHELLQQTGAADLDAAFLALVDPA